MERKMSETVFVAISGGVDSAAAAILLKERGYNVRGVTLRLKPRDLADKDIEDAKAVADTVNIPLDVLDMREDFKKVTDYFCTEYLEGRTPNPCVLCNPNIKFGKLLEYTLSQGGNFLATGHYANKVKDENGIYRIKMNPSGKDQSYFLCGLNQHILARTIFPIADLTKPEIRSIAAKHNIPVAQKKDSQEVCFIPDNDYISFIEREFNPKATPGDFLSSSGEKLGTHQGIYKYTIGQRKGLGAFGKPMYVLSIDAENNAVVIGDNDELFKSEIFIDNINFLSGETPSGTLECRVKIRCAAKPAKAIAHFNDGMGKITFDAPQRAAAPGQTAAIYIDDILIGGGTICNP
ncbi:MAG: tRNA 2-thiouridine(34) synthase MnmA [Acutalibacteraceae bacterium]